MGRPCTFCRLRARRVAGRLLRTLLAVAAVAAVAVAVSMPEAARAWGADRGVRQVAAVAVAVSMPAAPSGAGHSNERLVFRPPVDRPVADPFRPPSDPYGPGNRGVEYDTESGEVVRAAAAGTVVFSGAVAGSLHVTIDHGGGVVSSYSHLGRISVRVDARVGQGQVIATAGERLHFGVRVNGSYVDPFGFVGVRRIRVRLVPVPSWWSHR